MWKKYKDFIILLGCLIAIFQIYLYTTFPAFKNDDSPETITSAYTLGISHPPGYPLFTMAGKVASLLPVGSPAFRVNSFAVFLAMIVLLLSYFIIKQITFYVFNHENTILNYFGVFILAFSYIFWNQAIEAKGGIYILNLLFFTILIYLSIGLFKRFNIRHLYLMSFIYGLSLANHWPSIIILLPVFGYLFFRYREKMKQNNIITTILLLLTGLSPYFYLSIRSVTDGIFVYMAKPDTWENFWWTVSRTVYNDVPPPTLQLYKDQTMEFLKLFLNDFSFLWILIFFGGYALLKKNKKILFFYLSAFLIFIFMVIFYNRSYKEFIWLNNNYLIPAQYILFIFIMQGICFILSYLNKKTVESQRSV